MKRKNAKEIIDRAKNYIGRNLVIRVLDQKVKPTETIKTVFTGWAAVSLTEEDKMNVKLYANLADVNHSERMFSPSLKSVVEEFERLDSLHAKNPGGYATVAHGN